MAFRTSCVRSLTMKKLLRPTGALYIHTHSMLTRRELAAVVHSQNNQSIIVRGDLVFSGPEQDAFVFALLLRLYIRISVCCVYIYMCSLDYTRRYIHGMKILTALFFPVRANAEL